jgi:hypothetical protein
MNACQYPGPACIPAADDRVSVLGEFGASESRSTIIMVETSGIGVTALSTIAQDFKPLRGLDRQTRDLGEKRARGGESNT